MKECSFAALASPHYQGELDPCPLGNARRESPNVTCPKTPIWQRSRNALTSSTSEGPLMRTSSDLRVLCLLTALFIGSTAARPVAAQQAASLPSETPERFQPVTDSFNYIKRDVMIPMRDGVKLHTVIMIPKGAKNAPILLTRTPYSARRPVTPRVRIWALLFMDTTMPST